jgi:hypothetical protein
MLKQVIVHLVFLMSVAINSTAFAHDDQASRVDLESEISQSVSAGKVKYTFQLVDNQTNRVISDSDLLVTHERKLHLLAYDPALKEFQHVHPEYDGKVWSVELEFAVNGNYWIWAQGELADGKEDFSSATRLMVTGGQAEWPSPELTDMRTGSDGHSTVQLEATRLVAGQMAMLTVVLGRNDGSEPEITPYLGAFAHVIVTPQDGDSLIHVHPMNGENANEGMLHVTFPAAGLYRLWIQYLDGGELKVVPLSVEVF